MAGSWVDIRILSLLRCSASTATSQRLPLSVDKFVLLSALFHSRVRSVADNLLKYSISMGSLTETTRLQALCLWRPRFEAAGSSMLATSDMVVSASSERVSFEISAFCVLSGMSLGFSAVCSLFLIVLPSFLPHWSPEPKGSRTSVLVTPSWCPSPFVPSLDPLSFSSSTSSLSFTWKLQ